MFILPLLGQNKLILIQVLFQAREDPQKLSSQHCYPAPDRPPSFGPVFVGVCIETGDVLENGSDSIRGYLHCCDNSTKIKGRRISSQSHTNV